MSIEPRATYRFQFHPGFTLDDAVALIDYLDALGISHLYSSPVLQAAHGSLHGYDVVNPQQVNVELGGEEARMRLSTALQARGMGLMLDIVPNHMAIGGADNPWWWDVLKFGAASRYAGYFDLEWGPPETRHKNEVLVPVLGDQYGRVLDHGDIQVDASGPEFLVRYFDNSYPADPRTIGPVLLQAAHDCGSEELEKLANAYADEWQRRARTERSAAALDARLRKLRAEDPAVHMAVCRVVDQLNHDREALDDFLTRQNYRLAYWRITSGELGYRRFFDINTLIGLRMEDEEVFVETHRLILDWLRSGQVDGLRIDHPDGLRDPKGYFERLRASAPDAWVVIEKILEAGERLPADWPVDGTTGYDFLNRANAVLVDPRGEDALLDFNRRFTGRDADYLELVRQKKLEVIGSLLGSDINWLVELFYQVCERHRNYRDTTRREVRTVLAEMAACLPVYRTYVRAAEGEVSQTDRDFTRAAAEMAKANRPEIDPRLFDFFCDMLLLKVSGELENELVMRFQQFTGPVMAKGVEDTVFYNYLPLISMNEVGGDPGHFGLSVEEFHQGNAAALQQAPRGLLASTTHDTKRSEDVRARINVLSEIPGEWTRAVERWSQILKRARRKFPIDPNDEYLLYQTLVGAWPIEEERLLRYMEKAVREAKLNTSWTIPNAEYEAAVVGFTRAALRSRTFRKEFLAFLERIQPAGWVNALAQGLVKLCAPGVPDIYQGAELWVYTLVDPDNRAPVDYGLRRRLLAELDRCTPEEIWARAPEGLPKMHVLRQALALRRRHPEWFGPGSDYRPLYPSQGDSMLAFRRGGAICVVPRLNLRAGNRKEMQLRLPPGRWRNVFTGDVLRGEISVSDLLSRFPVALLEKI